MEARQGDVCRVCRSEGTSDRQLYHPCVCTGSIKYIHQECLVQWLKYSKKEYCELCKHRYTFTPIYAPDMPKRLPIRDLVTGLLNGILRAVRYWLHYTLVAFAWLGIVPLTACRIYRCLFNGTLGSVLTLPLDLLSTDNLLSDCFQGCFIVTCTLCTFISLVWLREQIMHGGGPDWLDADQQAAVDNNIRPNNNPADNNANNVPGVAPDNPAEAVPADAGEEHAEQEEDGDDEHEENNGQAQDEVNWNPMDWDRAAEDLTWERLLGLDGSLLFMEHVFWVVSLNTLFIMVFAFSPYHIGHFVIASLHLQELLVATHFEGLLTTLTGYIIIAVTLAVLHEITSFCRWTKAKRVLDLFLVRAMRVLGLCYVAIKVSLLVVMEIGFFPLICGWWLDICSLSLFEATLKDRENSFRLAPGNSMFIHWLVGMVYIFYFASFILLLREVLRPGVLWFLRNLNDPDFNPIQEMIHLPILRHARRFLASMVVFGTIVLVMLWFPVQVVRKLFPSFLPFYVMLSSSDTPVSELSLELLLLQVVLPALLEQGHTRQWLKSLVKAWCVVASWFLDLRSYLLGDEPLDEAASTEADEHQEEDGAAFEPNDAPVEAEAAAAVEPNEAPVQAEAAVEPNEAPVETEAAANNIDVDSGNIAQEIVSFDLKEKETLEVLEPIRNSIELNDPLKDSDEITDSTKEISSGIVSESGSTADNTSRFTVTESAELVSDSGVTIPVDDELKCAASSHDEVNAGKDVEITDIINTVSVVTTQRPSDPNSADDNLVSADILHCPHTANSPVVDEPVVADDNVVNQAPILVEDDVNQIPALAEDNVVNEAPVNVAELVAVVNEQVIVAEENEEEEEEAVAPLPLQEPLQQQPVVDIVQPLAFVGVPPVQGLGDMHQAMMQAAGPVGFQPYKRPNMFVLRLLCLLVLVCVTLFLASLASLLIPVYIGRQLMSIWTGETKVHELYTVACGLYACWVVLRMAMILFTWIPQGWHVIFSKVMEWTILVSKSLFIAAILIGIVPLMLGLIFELVIVMPIRVPLEMTPIFFPWQDWALGVLHAKIITAATMMGPQWRLKRVIEQVYQQGLRNMNLRFIMVELCLPVLVCLGLILAVPHVIAKSLVPALGFDFETQNLVLRRIYPFILGVVLFVTFCIFQARQFWRLYEHIKNDKYLVGQRLVNYERQQQQQQQQQQ